MPLENSWTNPPRRRVAVWAVTCLVAVVISALVAAGIAWSGPAGPALPAEAPGKGMVTAADMTAEESAAVNAPAAKADRLFAKRMYLEQVQSGGNIDRLAEGRITRLDIASRKVSKNTATIGIVAHFEDGSSAPGTVGFVRNRGAWYMFSMEGERSDSAFGYATGVDTTDHDMIDLFPGVPDSAIDWKLANAMVRQQKAHQEFAKAIVEGPTSAFKLGRPQPGAGTLSIDATVFSRGPGKGPGKVRLVLVPGRFEGRTYYFITTMRIL